MKDHSIKTTKKIPRFRTPSLYLARRSRQAPVRRFRENPRRRQESSRLPAKPATAKNFFSSGSRKK